MDLSGHVSGSWCFFFYQHPPKWRGRVGPDGWFERAFTASLMAQTVKRLPAVREAQVRSLGWKDPLAKEMATHSSTLAWRIPCREEPGGLQSMGSQRVGHDWATSLSVSSGYDIHSILQFCYFLFEAFFLFFHEIMRNSLKLSRNYSQLSKLGEWCYSF